MLKKKFFIAISIVLSVMLCSTFSYAAETEEKNWFQSLISFEWLTNIFGNNQETVEYKTVDYYNLGIKDYREQDENKNSYKYQIDSKIIWKVVNYPNDGLIEGQTPGYDKTIYCLRAEHGFFATENNGNIPDKTRKYDIVFNLKTGREAILNYYGTNSTDVLKALEPETYNRVLWILDNSYIKDISALGYRDNLLDAATEHYLKKYRDTGILQQSEDFTLKSSKTCADYLTDEDIDAIQQLAIWYYTNSDSDTYHFEDYDTPGESLRSAIKVIDNNGTESGADNSSNGLGLRYYAMTALYEYLIDNAKADYVSSTETAAPIELDKTRTLTITRDEDNLLAGPYFINKKSDLQYNLNYRIYDQDGTEITEYKILDKEDKELTEVPVGQEFYIEVKDNEEEISKIELEVEVGYTITTTEFLTSSNDTINQQPLVTVHKKDEKYTDNQEVELKPEEKEFDLALRKYITKVERDGKEVEISSRVPDIDITNLKNGTATTATYKHKKDPVIVETGDIVTYTITVYNEGDIVGTVYEIKDLLPEGVEFVEIEGNYIAEFNSTNRELTITGNNNPNNVVGNVEHITTLNAFDGTIMDSQSIQIKCKVTKEVSQGDEVLTNVARITNYKSGTSAVIPQEDIADRDSKPEECPTPSQNNLPAYKGKDSNKSDLSDKTYHYEGEEDDDDFEKLVIQGQVFDLSLRKFITAINDEKVTTRVPEVDVSKLNTVDSETGKQITTAVYNHPKNPLKVKIGDEVTYTIRVYNEGDIAGYAEEVTDHLPAWLEFIYDDELNTSYGWVLDESDKTLRTVKTNHLSKANDKDNLIDAFDGSKLDYKELKIKCKVKDTAEFNTPITNIADITDFTDKDGNDITDRDSSKNNVQLPEEENWPVYRDDKIEAGDRYIPGQEDDDDFEKVIIQDFDLALRKFIVKVNDKDLKENDKFLREPVVDASKLNTVDEETGEQITTAEYKHPKDPVEVENGDIVIYTLRIYNEGSMSGYADEIVDDVPEGLEFMPDHETNKEYEWQVSEDGSKITTTYLSKDSETEDRQNLIKAFDKNEMASPDYKDIQIAFKVTEPNTSDRILVNTAEITENSDENGKDVEDRDSIPGNNNEWNTEDDLDKEFLKVKYFDLALRKWVTRVILIEDGKQTVRETGHTAEMAPEPIVKVDLHRKKINSMTVKFAYMIKVTNQGEIAGYAKELTDYIPTGLKFEQVDNPMWKEKSSGVITTRAIENTLLEPGESAEVEVVLTWINDGDNMGVKTNIAEISEDYNESNSKDIDSTPNNKKTGEDDIDDAPVMLSIQPGSAKTYITLSGTLMAIFAAGVVAIKKFVLL